LRAALKLAEYGEVLIITKGKLVDSNTYEAQGGIAVVMDPKDSLQNHIKDTLTVGRGLCNKEAVEILVREGQERVKELIDWGARFDREGKVYHLTREAGHSHNRILHARGDATGKEIVRILLSRVMLNPNITFSEFTFSIDLLVKDRECLGVIAHHREEGFIAILAKAVVLCSGGAGQVFRETTNPSSTTGDGIAMAYRAGAEIMDMEFMQFHPTALYIAGTSRLLISEAVRGEGGILRNKKGERFMFRYHPEGEMAPRDVVSRSILEEMARTESTHVFLDLSHLPYRYIKQRFPHILAACKAVGIDVKKMPIPVRPSAHYLIGGVKVDTRGKTNLKNLYACGETACSGLHGANRLASNSLLEGLVFGYRVGEEVGESYRGRRRTPRSIPYAGVYPKGSPIRLDLEDVKMSLKSLMSWNVGIRRSEDKMVEAKERIDFWSGYIKNREFYDTQGWELQNMLEVATLMIKGAMERKESRGVHYRIDYPKEKKSWEKHIIIQEDNVYVRKI